jgi:hypothetical protein
MNDKNLNQQFQEDILKSMDVSYTELKRILQPVFHNKTKYVNGKLLKDCFRHIGDIINSHNILRTNIVK